MEQVFSNRVSAHSHGDKHEQRRHNRQHQGRNGQSETMYVKLQEMLDVHGLVFGHCGPAGLDKDREPAIRKNVDSVVSLITGLGARLVKVEERKENQGR